MNKILLNFLEVTFNYNRLILYVAEMDDQTNWDQNILQYKLPDENKNYKLWKVSFDKRDGFYEKEIDIFDNYNLTNKILFYSFTQKLKNLDGKEIQYEIEEKIKGSLINFIIKKTYLGKRIVYLLPYFLKLNNQLGFLIDFRFKKDEKINFSYEVLKESLSLDRNLRSNKNFYSDKYQIIQTFLNEYNEIFKDINCFGTSFNIQTNLYNMGAGSLEKRTYIFCNKSTSNSQFQGLLNYGPVKEVKEEVQYLFIFENKFRSLANELYLSLIGKLNPGTFPGLGQMFNLSFKTENFQRFEIDNYSQNTFEQINKKLQELSTIDKGKKIIGIFIEPEKDESFNSPYFRLKYLFTHNGIPLQVVTYDKLGDKNTLKWSTANVGLQIFSKLGGVPWLVKPSINNCLILGIGSAHEKKDDGSVKKYLAYAVCLDSSGLYQKLDVLATGTNKEEYFTEFKIQLKKLLELKEFQNYDKCVIHIPFKIKKEEIKSIFDVITTIKKFEFKIIKININNKFFGYSEHNTRIPYESSFLRISKSEFIVWFEGLLYGKENVYGKVANPVHIEFLNKDNILEKDISHLQDVINLSGANWRGFNSKLEPISIYYPRLIANYARIFEKYQEFDKSVFNNNLPWFL